MESGAFLIPCAMQAFALHMTKFLGEYSGFNGSRCYFP